MVVPRFVGAALGGLPLEIHGDGTQTRSFCHVADTVRALKGLMDAQTISGDVFNVGSTERVRIIDLAERIRELTSSRSELCFVPYDEVYGVGIEDTLHREPAIGKIASATGWRPSLDTGQILHDVIDHFRATSASPEQEALEAS
jgi:UDP-glucose 4-epimerase